MFSPGAIINETEWKMNPGRSLLVPAMKRGIAAGLLLVAGSCVGQPDLTTAADPFVVTKAGATSTVSTERAAAIAEMRGKAEAAESSGYPPAFQAERSRQLAARDEPRPVLEVEEIEQELAALAARRGSVSSPQEIAAMETRAAELRRLRAQAQGGS